MNKHGWLILEKKPDKTSMQAIREVKKILRETYYLEEKIKIGHGGTLDPFATGILPIAIGEATKLLPLFLNVNKAYVFKMVFGQKRDTGDITGKITIQDDINSNIYQELSEEKLVNILHYFCGHIMQTPHKMSAIRINGQRAYDMFRNEQEFILNSRKVFIDSIKLINFNKKNFTAEFYVKCGKGVYVRSLCEDIAKKLNVNAYVETLDRVEYGPLGIKTFGEIDLLQYQNQLLPMKECKKWFQYINLNKEDSIKISYGIPIIVNQADGIYVIFDNDIIIALGEVKDSVLKVLRGINNYQ